MTPRLRNLAGVGACVGLVFGTAALAGGLEYDPTILIVEFTDGMRIEVAATSPDTCEAAIRAIQRNFWRLRDDSGSVSATWCAPGNRFAIGSDVIRGFNDPDTLARRR